MKELKTSGPKSHGIAGALRCIFGSPRKNLDADAWRRCLLRRVEVLNLIERTKRTIEVSQAEMEGLLLTLPPWKRYGGLY